MENYAGPFADDTRNLAHQCLDRYYAIAHGDIGALRPPRADQEARNLIRTGFPAAIKDAQRAGNEMLALHIRKLIEEVPRDGAYLWLHQLAIKGAT